jgi:hypothetical protein
MENAVSKRAVSGAVSAVTTSHDLRERGTNEAEAAAIDVGHIPAIKGQNMGEIGQFASWYNISETEAKHLFATYSKKPTTYRELFRPGKSGNAKIDKADKLGYTGAILHLAPADTSGYQTCAWSTAACRDLCLNVSGHAAIPGSMERIHRSRREKTRFYFEQRHAFMASLCFDAFRLLKYGAQHKQPVCLRPNGTSDLVDIAHTVAKAFPMLQVYDYTKRPRPQLYSLPNYHLTFSASGENWSECEAALANGHNVTVVFAGLAKGQSLPTEYRGYPVFDGDVTDLRFLDPVGHIIGLRPKGRKARNTQTSAFLVPVGPGCGKTEQLISISKGKG